MRGAVALIAAAAGLLSASASAEIDWERVDLAQERAAIESFQSFDQRLQDTGWKLVRGNVDYCEKVVPSVGLQLQDLASYGSPEIARGALGMERNFAVQTAAQGSAAARSEALRPNREIATINGVDPNEWEAEERFYWQRLKRAHDVIDELLAENGSVEIGFAGGGAVLLHPVPVCAARFELAARSDEMRATSERVLIGTDSGLFAYDEDMFAAAIAHELAHTLLDHTGWRDRNGRGRANVRATEREADRLMPWLLANAGYDPAAAVRFFREFRPTSGSVLFIRGSHEKWQTRAALVEAELPVIAQLIEVEGKADWATYFRREVDPRAGL